MSLIIEDGTGLEDAESMVSVDYYLDYCVKQGLDSALTSGKEEAYLRRANDFMDSYYSFNGVKFKDTQSMPFPRTINGVYEFPIKVKNAICELVLKLPNGDLLQDTDKTTIREKVGTLEVEYDPNQDNIKSYNYVNKLLAPYLVSTSSFSYSISRV